jgi:hypothetical protein
LRFPAGRRPHHATASKGDIPPLSRSTDHNCPLGRETSCWNEIPAESFR